MANRADSPAAQSPATCLTFNDHRSVYAEMGNRAKLHGGGPITIQAWVFPTSIIDTRVVVSTSTNSSPSQGLVMRIDGGAYQVGFIDTSTQFHGASAPVPAGDVRHWVHLCGVFDGAGWLLYRNGQLANANPDPVGMPARDDWWWRIGGFDPSSPGGKSTQFWAGSIASLAIWKRALRPYDILENTAFPPVPTDLVGYWPMHDGSGDVMADVTDDPAPASIVNQHDWMPTPGWFPVGGVDSGLSGNADDALVAFSGGLCFVSQEIDGGIWTSPDGVAWTKMADTPPWFPRGEATVVAIGDNLYVMGGSKEGQHVNDVWRRTITSGGWQQQSDAPWGPRRLVGTATMGTDLFLMGGVNDTGYFNDVWTMSEDPATGKPNWVRQTPAASWAARMSPGVGASRRSGTSVPGRRLSGQPVAERCVDLTQYQGLESRAIGAVHSARAGPRVPRGEHERN